MKTKSLQIRQGDVFLHPVRALPPGAREVPLEHGRIVLAHGEATGHSHAIADHGQQTVSAGAASEIVDALIARCRARLYDHDGNRYLVVSEPVSLRHEEHTWHTVQPGVYEIPVQVEYDTNVVRRVTD